jgi:hypothetical protein
MYVRYIFKLLKLSAERSKAHGGYAESLRWSFAYFLHQFSKRVWKRFLWSARAVLEHQLIQVLWQMVPCQELEEGRQIEVSSEI